ITPVVFVIYYFFFQAEDGIRDFHVTGVQTCALPISVLALVAPRGLLVLDNPTSTGSGPATATSRRWRRPRSTRRWARPGTWATKIGRASCRERVEMLRVCVKSERK